MHPASENISSQYHNTDTNNPSNQVPALENQVPDLLHKRLNHKLSKSANSFTLEKAQFYRLVLPKISRAIRSIDERFKALPETTESNADAVKLANALCALVDMQRSLLGFPSPGRRRDTGDQSLKQMPQVHDVDTQDQNTPNER